MYEMQPFKAMHIPSPQPRSPRAEGDDECSVFKAGDVPKELDVFFRSEADLLPNNFDSLSPKEQLLYRSKYRFDPMKPGMYQTITGFGHMY